MLERLLICKMYCQVQKAKWNLEINWKAREVFVIFVCWIGRVQKDHKDFVVHFIQVSEPNGYKANSFSTYNVWKNDHNIKLMRCDQNVKTLIKKSFTHLGYIKRLIKDMGGFDLFIVAFLFYTLCPHYPSHTAAELFI